MPSGWSSFAFTSATTASICHGSEPPFVSQSVTTSAPPRTAARSVSVAYDRSSANPSKKCSAS